MTLKYMQDIKSQICVIFVFTNQESIQVLRKTIKYSCIWSGKQDCREHAFHATDLLFQFTTKLNPKVQLSGLKDIVLQQLYIFIL